MSSHASSPSAAAPFAPPISQSSSVESTPRRPLLPPRDALELAELLERIDADVRVGADAERDAAMADTHDGQEPVSEIRLGGRAGADRGAAVAEQVELGAVGVRRVDDRRPLAEAPRLGEELDRPQSVLGEALLDLARLLVGVDVERRGLRLRVPPDLLEPVARAGAHGVGGDADRDPAVAKRLDLGEVRRDRRLSHPIEPTARIRDVQAGRSDPRLLGRLRRGEGGVEPEVVELADRRVPRRPHLAVGAHVEVADRGRRLRAPRSASIPSRHAQKSPPAARPRSARWNAWLCALTKPGSETARGTGDDTNLRGDELRAVSAPLRQIPNALTLLRFAAIPLFVVLLAREQDGPSWPAGIVFGARRDHRPARRIPRAPLARRVRVRQGRRPARRPPDDRRAVVMLVVYDRLPWIALVILLARPAARRRATSSSCRAATSSRCRGSARSRRGGSTPRSGSCSSRRRARGGRSRCFWVNLALAVVAAGQYVLKARREVRR